MITLTERINNQLKIQNFERNKIFLNNPVFLIYLFFELNYYAKPLKISNSDRKQQQIVKFYKVQFFNNFSSDF